MFEDKHLVDVLNHGNKTRYIAQEINNMHLQKEKQ